MEIITTLQEWIDKIPAVIGFLRDIIIKILETFHLPAGASTITFIVMSLFFSYLFLKQFVTSSLWMKLSTLLNLILLSLLFYLTITKV